MLTDPILRAFARMDTTKQVTTLARVGFDTECADRCLGHLAGNYPEQFQALTGALARRDGLLDGTTWVNQSDRCRPMAGHAVAA